MIQPFQTFQTIDGTLHAGRAKIPVSEIDDVFASSSRPSVGVNIALLLACTVFGVPTAVSFSQANAAGDRGNLLFVGIGLIALYALFQLVWAPEKYRVVIRRRGKEQTVLRTEDSQQVTAAVAKLQQQLRRPTPPPG